MSAQRKLKGFSCQLCNSASFYLQESIVGCRGWRTVSTLNQVAKDHAKSLRFGGESLREFDSPHFTQHKITASGSKLTRGEMVFHPKR